MRKHRQKIFVLAIAIIMLISLAIPALADGPMTGGPEGGNSAEASNSPQTIYFDGVKTKIEAYAIDGHNYLKIRDIAYAMTGSSFEFEVDYNAPAKTVYITKDAKYTTVGGEFQAASADKSKSCVQSSWNFIADSTAVSIGAYIIGGNNFCKLVDLAEVIGFSVSYDSGENAVYIGSELPAYSLNLADYSDQWVYYDSVEIMSKGVATGNYADVDLYALEGVVYCANPVDSSAQCMNIYVPAAYMTKNADGTVSLNHNGYVTAATQDGTKYTYTTNNAPIYFVNGVDAYKSATVSSVGNGIKGQNVFSYYDYVNRGFILVSPACRGRDSNTDTQGFAPSGLVDLKAAVRFLKYNDAVLAGSSEKIISVGGSAGGGMSALLGATGNSNDYDEYLADIGAANTTDDIYASMCYCPITDLEYADGAYEWLHKAESSYTGYIGGGTLDSFQLALQSALYDGFVDYVQKLELNRQLGNDGRSGSYYTDYLAEFEDSLSDYLANNFKTVEERKAYIAENVDPEGIGYVTYNATTGKVTISSIDDLVTNYSSIARAKGVPSFDALESNTNENSVFSLVNGTTQHFSQLVADALLSISNKFPEAAKYRAEYVTDFTEELLHRVYIMNPMNYISDNNSDNAPYWRFVTGSADGDLSSVSSWLLANALESHGNAKDVQYKITWVKPHGTADYSIMDQVDWVVSITT